MKYPAADYTPNLQRWLDHAMGRGDGSLAELLADDAVFTSPVVHTPQHGKAITLAYLTAAEKMLGNETFKYTRIFDCGDRAVLEFETVMDAITVNGVDMIEWNEAGEITDFKVMVRPLKGMQAVHAAMGRALAAMKTGNPI